MLRTLFFTLILLPLDTSNGVDFEIHTGMADGNEKIPLVPFHGYQEIYEQPVV
jgi:hypothetical protein